MELVEGHAKQQTEKFNAYQRKKETCVFKSSWGYFVEIASNEKLIFGTSKNLMRKISGSPGILFYTYISFKSPFQH